MKPAGERYETFFHTIYHTDMSEFLVYGFAEQRKAVSTQRENHFHMNDIQFSGTEMDECEIFLTFYSFSGVA